MMAAARRYNPADEEPVRVVVCVRCRAILAANRVEPERAGVFEGICRPCFINYQADLRRRRKGDA